MFNKPILSFCYANQPQRSWQDVDDIRSTASMKTDRLTQRTTHSAKVSIQRVNEIRPKPKIILPPHKPIGQTLQTLNQQQTTTSFKPNQQQQQQQPQKYPRPMLKFESESIGTSRQAKKGLFNWPGIGLLCGMASQQQFGEGCTCESQCSFKKEWTKSHRESDLNVYLQLRGNKVKEEHQLQIDKDLHRTYPESLTFSQPGIFRQMLREVLSVYSIYDCQLGYVQGLNNIAAVIVYHIKNAELSFWALVELMETAELRLNYIGKLQGLRTQCEKIQRLIEIKNPTVYNHIQAVGPGVGILLHGWIIGLLSKLLPLDQMHHLVNGFKESGWNYIYRVILAFFRLTKDCILMAQDQFEIASCISYNYYQQQGLQWQQLFKQASKMSL